MAQYEPIGDLIDQMPAKAWELIAQINDRHRGMMVCELLEYGKRALENSASRKPRSLKNHPSNPQPHAPKAG